MGRQPKEELAPIKYIKQLSAQSVERMAKFGGHTKLKGVAEEMKKKEKKA